MIYVSYYSPVATHGRLTSRHNAIGRWDSTKPANRVKRLILGRRKTRTIFYPPFINSNNKFSCKSLEHGERENTDLQCHVIPNTSWELKLSERLELIEIFLRNIARSNNALIVNLYGLKFSKIHLEANVPCYVSMLEQCRLTRLTFSNASTFFVNKSWTFSDWGESSLHP
jgi:hypothetical protein